MLLARREVWPAWCLPRKDQTHSALRAPFRAIQGHVPPCSGSLERGLSTQLQADQAPSSRPVIPYSHLAYRPIFRQPRYRRSRDPQTQSASADGSCRAVSGNAPESLNAAPSRLSRGRASRFDGERTADTEPTARHYQVWPTRPTR